MGKVMYFTDSSADRSTPALPVYEQRELEVLSRFKRSEGELIMEFIYSEDTWLPTWKMTREVIDKLVSRDTVDVTFVVRVKEGSILKRVEKRNGETVTRLFSVTRWGLLDVLYDYERGVYILNTGIVLKSR